MPIPEESNSEQQAEQPAAGEQAPQQQPAAGAASGPAYPRLQAVLEREAAAREQATPAAAAPVAKPAAGAPPAQGQQPRTAPLTAKAIALRQREATIAQKEAALQQQEAGLVRVREVEAMLAKGDRVAALRALSKDDADYFELISAGATDAAGVKAKDPKVAARDLPPAVQAELQQLRALAGEVPKLKESLEKFQGERTQALQSLQLEEQTRRAQDVWAGGWKSVEAAAGELPHVVVAGDSPEAQEAQEEARQMVESRFLELAQSERAKTRAPVGEAKARELVVQAAREVNGRLAKLLKRGAGPGTVTAGRPQAAPRATSTKQPGASASQGTGRPKALPATVGDPPPVDRSKLPERERLRLAAENLAKKFPHLAG